MKLIIEVQQRDHDWIDATVEDQDGNLLGRDTAPLVEGATFDTRAAVIRSSVEVALANIASDR